MVHSLGNWGVAGFSSLKRDAIYLEFPEGCGLVFAKMGRNKVDGAEKMNKR